MFDPYDLDPQGNTLRRIGIPSPPKSHSPFEGTPARLYELANLFTTPSVNEFFARNPRINFVCRMSYIRTLVLVIPPPNSLMLEDEMSLGTLIDFGSLESAHALHIYDEDLDTFNQVMRGSANPGPNAEYYTALKDIVSSDQAWAQHPIINPIPTSPVPIPIYLLEYDSTVRNISTLPNYLTAIPY